MKKLYTSYRVLAFVVGVLLAFCALVSLPLKYLASEGSALQTFGSDTAIVWALHGWMFIIYVVVAFFLSRRAEWTIPFTLLVLIAGLVPLLIFYVERVVSRKVRAEFPEELGLEPAYK